MLNNKLLLKKKLKNENVYRFYFCKCLISDAKKESSNGFVKN